MLLELPNVPPCIPLLFSEIFVKITSFEDAFRRLKALLPELETQSRSYWESELLAGQPSYRAGELNVFVHGGLDLFSHNLGCADLKCRIDAARRLARSLGLLGDTIWLTDYLTDSFLDIADLSDKDLYRILDDILVLCELYPLISAGIVKFRSPWKAGCRDCINEFDRRVETVVDGIFPLFDSEFVVEEMLGGMYALHTGDIYSPSMVLRVSPTRWLSAQRLASAGETKRAVLHSAVRSLFWTSNEARQADGVVFSNSNVGVAALAQMEHRLKTRSDIRLFDERRCIEIPWVSKLDASQIVDLRSEASKALPAFRELIARHLNYSKTADENKAADLVNELRSQALDARNELEVTQKSSATFLKAGYAILGLGISAYGLGMSEVVPAAGGILPIIQLLMQHKGGSEKDMEKLSRRPGYVLVKAQEILGHDH